MTPLSMAIECVRALKEPGITGVVLTIPKGKTPKGFPCGEVLNEVERNGRIERTSSYSAERVLFWLHKNELVGVEVEGNQIKLTDLCGKGLGATTGEQR